MSHLSNLENNGVCRATPDSAAQKHTWSFRFHGSYIICLPSSGRPPMLSEGLELLPKQLINQRGQFELYAAKIRGHRTVVQCWVWGEGGSHP